MRVYSHSYWLVIFCTTNSSRVLARERWQIFENSWKKTQYFMNNLYKSLYSSIYLSTYVSICIYVCIFLSIHLSFIYLSICLLIQGMCDLGLSRDGIPGLTPYIYAIVRKGILITCHLILAIALKVILIPVTTY